MHAISVISAVLASAAAIIGGVVYLFKFSTWAIRKTEDQQNQDIDAEIQKEKQEAEDTGRPV